MRGLRSKLYAGNVWHRRTSPKAYEFHYGVYYFDLDLDEIGDVDRGIRVFGYNRRNVLSFRDSDHMSASGLGIRDALREHLSARGVDPDGVRVSLLTNTRVFGYVFNPVSFYFVRDRATLVLQHVIAEVHNTHGERHVYDLDRAPGGEVYASTAEKAMYVSPFIEMDARYAFECREDPGGAYDLRIDEYRGDDLFFQAQLRVAPQPLTNANVTKMLIRYPFMTLKTIGLIHWQGLKLWLRGVKYLPYTPPDREARR